MEERKVYNLQIEDYNEFFANNILVHNSDAFANSCYAAKRLIGATPSFIPLKTPSESVPKDKKLKTMVCPSCEKEGKDGYYQGYTDKPNYLQRIDCPRHTATI